MAVRRPGGRGATSRSRRCWTGLGSHEWQVTTAVPRAQQFFNQGLRLLYAFNHTEALRAFREAARLDPELAMAFWGQAMTLGPNLNAPLTPENARQAYAAIQAGAGVDGRSIAARARARSRRWRRDLRADGVGDRPALDRAYASAMATRGGGVSERSRRADLVRRRGHEHDAVGLLAEGRIAEAGDDAPCSRRSNA